MIDDPEAATTIITEITVVPDETDVPDEDGVELGARDTIRNTSPGMNSRSNAI